MKKERLQVIILIVIIMFGISYAYFKFLFLPQWAIIQGDTDRLKSLQKQYQELLNYQQNMTSLKLETKTFQDKVIELKAQLPSQIDKPQIMVGLYTLAKEHAVVPQAIAFEQAQSKGSYQEIGISFSCSGKPSDLLATIHDLQFGRGQRVAVKSLSLTGSQGSMRADLKLTAYASIGSSNNLILKPTFMNSSFGVDSPEKMFHP
jgi:Tfp pilus assembly protein PilO